LVQSCRGTGGSGGKFDPFRQERADGIATLEWIKKQDWFPGVMGLFGYSYLGYAALSIAGDAGSELKALVVLFSTSDMGLHHYWGGSFTLEDAFLWTAINFAKRARAPENIPPDKALLYLRKQIENAYNVLPLSELDKLVLGEEVEFWQNLLRHTSPDDPYWIDADHRERVRRIRAPTLLIGGWYDIFLPGLVRDYISLREAGVPVRLVVGPWTHIEGIMDPRVIRESISWLRCHLLGDEKSRLPPSVELFVMGINEWRTYSSWPPPEYRHVKLYLHPGGKLEPSPPPESKPDRYTYDPADPTPNIGGPKLVDGGPKDNRILEARQDVLIYTSDTLKEDLEVVGEIRAELYVRSNRECVDFFVRVLDVHPSGESINISDGIVSVKPGIFPRDREGVLHITLSLWPTAHVFRRGHSIRILIASAAHPRYARNTCSCEPLATARTLLKAENEVFHDPSRPSAILLPIKVQHLPF